jgi:hypothetical protein
MMAGLRIRRVRSGVVLFGLMIGSMSLVMGCGDSGKTETLTEPTLVSTPEEESGSDAAQRAAIKAQAAENQNQSPY